MNSTGIVNPIDVTQSHSAFRVAYAIIQIASFNSGVLILNHLFEIRLFSVPFLDKTRHFQWLRLLGLVPGSSHYESCVMDLMQCASMIGIISTLNTEDDDISFCAVRSFWFISFDRQKSGFKTRPLLSRR